MNSRLLKHHYAKNKKSLSFGFLLLLALFGAIFWSPVNLALGNLFFDHSAKIYNLTLAQFFFKNSSVGIFTIPSLSTNYQLSRTYFIQGEFSKAIESANKELQLYPKNCRTYYIRGLTYAYINNLDKAIEDFETFNTMCVKDSWAGHNDLAWLYFRKGDLKKALLTVEATVFTGTNSLNPWIQNTYGTILMNVGRYEEAERAFRVALERASTMTADNWGDAYPGNDPAIYAQGLFSMRESIAQNLKILESLKKKK